jgi:hypothetical protein
VARKATQKHGKVVHRLNDREAVVWDATDISPEVAERFDRALARRIVANNEVLNKLGLVQDASTRLEGPSSASQTA